MFNFLRYVLPNFLFRFADISGSDVTVEGTELHLSYRDNFDNCSREIIVVWNENA